MKIGDRVQIAESSIHFGESLNYSNPTGGGTLISPELSQATGHPLRVKWDNGLQNAYEENDLILIKGGSMKTMTKSDLKTGMFVKYREGGYYLFTGECFSGGESFGKVEYYSEKLCNRYDKVRDVVAIYRVIRPRPINAYLEGEDLTLIWERQEKTSSQLELEKLKGQINALQEQAKKLEDAL